MIAAVTERDGKTFETLGNIRFVRLGADPRQKQDRDQKANARRHGNGESRDKVVTVEYDRAVRRA